MLMAATRSGHAQPYDEEMIQHALLQLALAAGHPTRAAERLREAFPNQPRYPDPTAISAWAKKRPDQYHRIREGQAPQLAERAAQGAEELILRAEAIERRLLERIDREVDGMEASTLHGALLNVTKSKSLQQDKIASPLRGRPNIVVERKDPAELISHLEQLLQGPKKVQSIEGSAEDA